MSDLVDAAEPQSAIPPADAPIAELLTYLVRCEHSIHRYQWASGLIIHALIASPETPDDMISFVDWLGANTGMLLSQQEVTRRLTVFKFYSRFSDDPEMIKLIEISGVRIAYQAAKVVDVQRPEEVREVLQACVANPGTMDETLRRYRTDRPSRYQRRIRADTHVTRDQMRRRILELVMEIDGERLVSVDAVLKLLDRLR